MVKKTSWVERKFTFNLPVGVFPCIIERLRGTPSRIADIVKDIPEEVLSTKVENTWSIKEQVGHLHDVEELHDGRIDDYLSGASLLRPADMKNRKTEEAEHNSKGIEELVQQFRQSRMQFVRRLEQLGEEEAALTAMHPRLNLPMRLMDMAFFVAEHDDHHLARITELSRMSRPKS